MNYKKVLLLLCIVFLIIWSVLFYRINHNIKQPIYSYYEIGDSFLYYGLEITPMKISLYEKNSFENEFGYLLTEEYDDLLIIVVDLHIKNSSGYDIRIKDSLHTWMIETNNFSNGQNMEFMNLNTSDPYKKDSDVDYKLFFQFMNGINYFGGIEKLKKSEIRLYMSFYPEARCIVFNKAGE